MGLDLDIREEKDFKTNADGKYTWTVVSLFNLRNCWKILEKLDNRLDSGGFGNCASYYFNEGTLHAILNELYDDINTYGSSDDLDYEVEKLKEFFEQENLVADENATDEEYGRTFEIHAWW